MHAAVMIVLTIIAKDPRTLPGWPLYDANDTFLWLDSEIRPGNDFRKGQCDFWDWLIGLKP